MTQDPVHNAINPNDPPTPTLRFVTGGQVLLQPEVDHGLTPRGRRLHVPITGGRLDGPRLRAKVLPGGADWQLIRTDRVFELEAVYDLCCDDGTLVHVRNQAIWRSDTGDWPARYAMCQPRFEAPLGPHDWLNDHLFVGTIAQGDATHPSIRIDVFQLLMPDMS
ncbi:MAG: DUF3237 family protein [Hydrogenophaga sp.]|jgi:hypothetical protein|nr:DUF3237 family protein [Hydrogenophaga sp.]